MIALVTTQAARGHDHDLDILTAALDAADQQWQIVNWDDASLDWSQFSIAVLRSTTMENDDQSTDGSSQSTICHGSLIASSDAVRISRS